MLDVKSVMQFYELQFAFSLLCLGIFHGQTVEVFFHSNIILVSQQSS